MHVCVTTSHHTVKHIAVTDCKPDDKAEFFTGNNGLT